MRPGSSRPILAILGTWGLVGVAAVFVGSSGPRAWAADPAPADRGEEVRSALQALRSPYLREREEAVSLLIRLGSSARIAVLRAFENAPPDTRALLVRVMAADGSTEDLDALLTTLLTADPHTARAIERALIEHTEALEGRVAAWRDAKGVPPRVIDLMSLLRRARIEKAFLSRKSRSGSTGYYRGQFDLLKPDRKEALKICLAIFADSPVKLPGEFPAGGFRFLRDPPYFVDPDDLRMMAGNAVAELVQEDDEDEIHALEKLYARLVESTARDRSGRALLSPEDAYLDVALAILCRVKQGDYCSAALFRARRHSSVGNRDSAAMLLLRLGRFEDAVRIYEDRLMREEVSAIPYYNLACAHCSWALDLADVDEKTPHLRLAMTNLTLAVDAGYADWPWMEQDRDLDPIRGMPEYQVLLARVKERMSAPVHLAPPPPPVLPPPPAMDGR